jgi:hypothetical protein
MAEWLQGKGIGKQMIQILETSAVALFDSEAQVFLLALLNGEVNTLSSSKNQFIARELGEDKFYGYAAYNIGIPQTFRRNLAEWFALTPSFWNIIKYALTFSGLDILAAREIEHLTVAGKIFNSILHGNNSNENWNDKSPILFQK